MHFYGSIIYCKCDCFIRITCICFILRRLFSIWMGKLMILDLLLHLIVLKYLILQEIYHGKCL